MKNCVLLATMFFTVSSATGEEISFNRDIRPLLSDNCYFCHGFDEHNRQADLRLDVFEDAEYVLEPGDPEASELLRRILSDDPDEVMPPPEAHKKPLTEEQVALIRQWIADGAVYEDHWAFVNPTRPDTGGVMSVAGAVDYFVGQRHAEHELSFAPEAAPAKWLRRASLDLTGLPPTVEQMRSFEVDVAERGEPAYADAVDRLFASPHFGERMALNWLDVARYADTNGFQNDAYRMNWPWRDWVVDAFNANMSFDQFTIEQLAGDLLEEPTQDQLIATAFNRNHMLNGEGGAIREENLAKTAFDRVETTGTTWLGLTVGCSQCHDHKFDPVKQKDYYALYAFFNQVDETAGHHRAFHKTIDGADYKDMYMVDKPYIVVQTEEQKQHMAELKATLQAATEALDATKKEHVAAFQQWILEMREDPSLIAERIDDDAFSRNVNTAPLDKLGNAKTKGLLQYFLEHNEPWAELSAAKTVAKEAVETYQVEIPLVMVMRDDGQRDTFILDRGNYETPTDQVTAAVPEFLPPLPDGAKADRLALAQWLLSDDHPLTARVTVNRFWQLIFGRGIVKTPDDFGLQGALPSHPELLDWLAVEFRESGWDVQALLKGIVLSQTYRQTAEVDETVIHVDPENIWLARGTRYRLDSRLLRDQALALSGLLVERVGGAPVAPYQPGGIWEPLSLGRNHYTQGSGDDLYRRSLYTVWRRIVAPANFFDVPSRQQCIVTPQRTSTPLHALTTLNDVQYVEAARVWAERLQQLDNDSERLRHLFYAATGRDAVEAELASLSQTLVNARTHFEANVEEANTFIGTGESKPAISIEPAEHAAWTTVCLLVLNLDETLSK